MMAPVGTPVRAATDGTIEWITLDPRAEHTGEVFGDQVTIKSSNGAMKTFYTHIDLDDEIKRQWDNGKGAGKITVKRGQVIGWVTTWKNSPSGTHLHFSAASKRPDGSYKGIDPTPLLDKTKGTTEAHDVTFSEDGGYTLGDPRRGLPYRQLQLGHPSPSKRLVPLLPTWIAFIQIALPNSLEDEQGDPGRLLTRP